MKQLKPIGEKCPDCVDGYLVERINSLTKNTFIGCSEWPDCSFTKRGGENPSPIKKYVNTWEDDSYDLENNDSYYGGSGDCEGPF